MEWFSPYSVVGWGGETKTDFSAIRASENVSRSDVCRKLTSCQMTLLNAAPCQTSAAAVEAARRVIVAAVDVDTEIAANER